MPIGPFVVFALPRSRTAWLSKFLTYGRWTCGHEEARHFRALEDVKGWLTQPCTGTVETAAAPWWRLLVKYRPDVRIVVVRRPVEAVVESLMALDMQGSCIFDRAALTQQMYRLDAKLDQIEARAPNVLSVQFDDLGYEDVCAEIFEHCLPYRADRDWWCQWRGVNVQCSMPALVRYATAFAPQLNRVAGLAKQAILADFALRKDSPMEGVGIAQESFETWYRDCKHLFREHLAEVGESPDAYSTKNLELLEAIDRQGDMQIMVARCNGKPFGYLMSEVAPSRERRDLISAVHTTFFASKAIPGLGMRLEREALRSLKARGVGEVWGRAGPRGAGPRLGSFYRRVGFADDGQLYRLNLEEA